MDNLTVVGKPVIKQETIDILAARLHVTRWWGHRLLCRTPCESCRNCAHDALFAASRKDQRADNEKVINEILWRLDEIDGVESVSSIWDMKGNSLTIKAEFTR